MTDRKRERGTPQFADAFDAQPLAHRLCLSGGEPFKVHGSGLAGIVGGDGVHQLRFVGPKDAPRADRVPVFECSLGGCVRCRAQN
jgi:hypothetical protein